MQRSRQTFAFLCALLPLAAASHAKDDGTHEADRAFFKQVYAYREAGWKQKSPARATALMANDFVQYDIDNTVIERGKKWVRAGLEGLIYATDIKMQISVPRIIFTKQGAIVTQVMTRSYKEFPRYNEVDIDERVTSRDIWSRTGDGWQQKRSKIVRAVGKSNLEHFVEDEHAPIRRYSP